MNADQYKRLKESGNVLDFNTLKVTLRCLQEAGETTLEQSVANILANNKINKPESHNKVADPQTDYYTVNLSVDGIKSII